MLVDVCDHEYVLSEHAEADSFFCFTNLMTEVGDKFTKKLDFSHTGIGEPKLIL